MSSAGTHSITIYVEVYKNLKHCEQCKYWKRYGETGGYCRKISRYRSRGYICLRFLRKEVNDGLSLGFPKRD